MAGIINPLCIKNGIGLDFNDSQTISDNTIYTIGNLSNQTQNSPVASSAACVFFRVSSDNYYRYDLLIGIDAKLMYGRYSYGSSYGAWFNLL